MAINGTTGNDDLYDTAGDDIINAGAGDDTVTVTTGNDNVDGGDGTDGITADMSAETLPIVWNLQTNAFSGTSDSFVNFEHFVSLKTGSGDDVITTRGRDAPDLGDTIDTGAGNDTIYASVGDSVSGGLGNDTLVIDFRGGGGHAYPYNPFSLSADGQGGLDGNYYGLVQLSSIENFVIYGSDGNGYGGDTWFTGNGNDIIYAGSNDDIVFAGAGINQADGGAGVDGIGADLTAATGPIVWNMQTNSYSGPGSYTNFEYWNRPDPNYYGNGFPAASQGGLWTGSGDDVITAAVLTASRAQYVNTGLGNDRLTAVNGVMFYDAADGIDTLVVDFSRATTRVVTGFFGGNDAPEANPDGGYDGRYTFTGSGDVISGRVTFTSVETFDITTGSGNDLITTGDGADIVRTGAGDDTILTLGGDDYVDGGSGADAMTGGAGNDVYIVDDANDMVSESSGEGVDEIRTSLAIYQLTGTLNGEGHEVENLTGLLDTGQTLTGNNLGNLIKGGAGSDALNGGSGNDALYGNAGDDQLTGGSGNDILSGGTGDDSYYLVNATDTIVENAGEGTDTIYTVLAAFSIASIANVENLTNDSLYTNVTLTGNSLDNAITTTTDPLAATELNGQSYGNDRIDGGAGTDTMTGGVGNDTYVVDSLGDMVVENAGEGSDTIETALASYSLAGIANVENLTGTSATGQVLTGSDGVNAIAGGSGDDVIDGKGGADVMLGGAGNDLYYVDDSSDVVVENANGGQDEIRTSLVTYSLQSAPNVEKLTGTAGSGPQDLRGNLADNVIASGAAADFIRLQDGGDDVASTGGGNDAIYFGAALTAADEVDGGDGRDVVALQGDYSGGVTLGALSLVNVETLSLLTHSDGRFGGDSTTAYSYGVTTVDGNVAAGAQLIVNASTLEAGENLTFNGSAETDGNFFIYGGKGIDTLTGGSGADVFFFAEDGRFAATDHVDGGAGNDVLVLRGDYDLTLTATSLVNVETVTLMSGADARFYAEGTPFSYAIATADSTVAGGQTMTFNGGGLGAGEVLNFDGSAETDGSFRIFGGAAADSIHGGGGGDLIFGGLGADLLAGGGGNDIFRYQSAGDSTVASRDHILDFSSGDIIDLSRVDANSLLGGSQHFTFIGTDGFGGHAGELRIENSSPNVWQVSGDVDGDGQADFQVLVTIADHHALAGSDFLL